MPSVGLRGPRQAPSCVCAGPVFRPGAHDGTHRRRQPAADPVPDRQRTPVGGARAPVRAGAGADRSEEHTSELQSLMRISYAVFCSKKKTDMFNFNFLLLSRTHTV